MLPFMPRVSRASPVAVRKPPIYSSGRHVVQLQPLTFLEARGVRICEDDVFPGVPADVWMGGT